MKTIDEPMPICEAEMERLEDQLVEDCKSLGMAESIRDFLQEPFSEWMDELADESSGGDDSSPECRLSRNGAGALAIAMQQTMAVRDALLVSIIVDERRSSRDFLMGFMANPTLPGNTRHLEESLNGSFRDASRKPDTKRCDNGVNMMFDIIGMVPERYHVQPLAIISYVLWWMGDERAMLCAMRALALDENCSLAAIICSAAHRHIGPVWGRRDIEQHSERKRYLRMVSSTRGNNRPCKMVNSHS